MLTACRSTTTSALIHLSSLLPVALWKRIPELGETYKHARVGYHFRRSLSAPFE